MKDNDVKISIITVCFNSEKTIATTIESVLKQSYQNYEYIIVDGNSKDHTVDIIRSYEPVFAGRMKWISEPDRGIYDAMNKGIKMATGTLIGIVNSDDYYELDALEQVAQAYQGNNLEIVYGMIRLLQAGQETMVYIKNHSNIQQDMIAHPGCFISKALYNTYGVYSLDFPYSADYEFMLRIHQHEDVHYTEVYRILSNFSIDGASSTIQGYRDTLRLKKQYGLISKQNYLKEMCKSRMGLMLWQLKQRHS